MRILRSFLATITSTPSSCLRRPIFHASATRIENCSIASGWVLGTISSAIWLPRAASKDASCCSSCACCAADSVPLVGDTRLERRNRHQITAGRRLKRNRRRHPGAGQQEQQQ